MKIEDVRPYPNNAKVHTNAQLVQLAKIVKEVGWRQPVVVNQSGMIIIGHGRYFTYQKYSKEYALDPIWIMDDAGVTIHGGPATMPMTEEQERAYRLADNKLNESDWDMQLVIQELKVLSLPMLDLTGFDRMLILDNDEKDDIVPENVPTRAKTGDIWALGRHRVMCGDSTKKEDVERLMEDSKASKARLLFTSPPYNMGSGMYEHYEDNLKSEEYIEFNIRTIDIWKDYLFGFLFWNISYNKKSRWEFIEILYRIIKETGLKFLELIVWNKKHALPITSKEMMTRQYEDILAVTNDLEAGIEKEIEMAGILRNDKKAYFNKKTGKWLSNYWEILVNQVQLKNHLACYPVALPTRAILIMTNENDIVSDPFLGSGSTLIACEKTNRICYGMDIDPKYVDVIIQRWCDWTGNKEVVLNGEEIQWVV